MCRLYDQLRGHITHVALYTLPATLSTLTYPNNISEYFTCFETEYIN